MNIELDGAQTPMTATSETRKSSPYRTALAAAFLLGAVTFPMQAGAVSMAVKMACLSDYLSNCSSFQVGSQELRQCMRSAGPNLSKGCINALVAAGEVSQSEVSRRSASLR
jgi:hypothetical protein